MLSISSCSLRQQCRPEHQKEQRENGHYALSLGFPEAGETNDKSGVLHNFHPKVGTKTYRILSPQSMVWGSACRRVARLDCHVPGDPLPGLIRSVRAAHAGLLLNECHP